MTRREHPVPFSFTPIVNEAELTMADPDTGTDVAAARRRGPDLVALAAGLAALAIAASSLLGGFEWLPGIDARWVLAAVAILVGLVLVIGSVRHQRG